MKNVKKVMVTLASVVALSQPAIANESARLSLEATAALSSILADNIANIDVVNSAESADQTFAKLSTKLQTNLLVAEAVKSLPQAPKFKVIIAD